MTLLENTINELVENGILSHAAVRVGMGDAVLYDTFRGGVDEKTLFDMASVTKIMATTMLALIAMDRGLLCIGDPIGKFFPTAKPLTVKHLLTHTMGIGHKALNQDGNTYENIAERILYIPSDLPIGTDVRYSCPGFILLGKILEGIFGARLDACFDSMVAHPIGLQSTSFLPKDKERAVNSNSDPKACGTVNDYNCRFLGGVAGNAGLFSCLSDVTEFVHVLLQKGKPLMGEDTFLSAVKNHTIGMSESRGLGFLYVDDRYQQAGGLFADGAIGHCGHTGQSVFVDYRTGLYAIVLSDATVSTVRKYGKEHYDEVVDMRARIHKAIKQDLSVGFSLK